MSEPGDLQPSPWLVRNWQPKESMDITPWLQERYKRNIEAQKLPLELQGMELHNKAQQLAIEHQGIQNDLANQEMDAFAEDLPKLRSYLETVSKTPGGSLDVTPPAFRSTKAIQSVLQRQKMDADTILGKTMMEDQIAATKQAAQLRQIGIDPTPAYVNGRWDSSLLSDMGLKATEDANIREANLIQQRNAHYADKNLVEASRIAELKSQIDAAQSVISSSPSPVMTPEKKAALDTATKAKYELDALEKTPSITPQLQVIEGEKFLVNPKTGAIHKISKNVSRQEFISSHISSWMKDNLWTAEQASQALNDFYDKNLATTDSVRSVVRVQKPDGTIGTLPAARLDEAIQAGWKKVE